jgi:hypothetical protein
MAFSLKRASKRRTSLFTFTVKVIAGRWLFVLICCLREAGFAQAAIAFEDPPALAKDRLCADGGELVAPVRFVVSSVLNAVPAQPVDAVE